MNDFIVKEGKIHYTGAGTMYSVNDLGDWLTEQGIAYEKLTDHAIKLVGLDLAQSVAEHLTAGTIRVDGAWWIGTV